VTRTATLVDDERREVHARVLILGFSLGNPRRFKRCYDISVLSKADTKSALDTRQHLAKGDWS